MTNITNTHAYIQAEVNMMFTKMHARKAVKFFGERAMAAIIKEFKQLDEGEIPVKLVVILLNLDEITY